ncbi:hypothetical protein JAAARDRAFT_120944 [Jaapia argillacea MUCL 33604]|uniref:FAS1 domain-containing protein n=1 Tax=Jaapia argillacea MUCL 33604 TaxID=933084 RepID=A0A067QLF4_9AGAM|nr:hypothetical protein JAAARDRAFT_120944 [Jaapia argillacea MUCL 33604]
MRLPGLVPISILAALPFVSASQTLLESPTVLSTTLVTALSNDPDYTLLLRLLQRARLIPTLNRLNGSTLFAPTNDAIERHRSSNSLWHAALMDDAAPLQDNIQEKLRQELFYHLLNYTLPSLPTASDPEVHLTLHFPRKPLDPPTHEPPPSPPWMPVPGGTLGGKPQRIRIASRDGGAYIGVDGFGVGGAKVVKGQVDAGNGLLLGIGDVLQVPPDLATVVSGHSSVSYFNKIITDDIVKVLNSTANVTIFLPVDSAWDSLHPIERLYLESEFATDDLLRILEMHAVVSKGVKWSEHFDPGINLTTIDGSKIEVISSPEKTMISDATLIEPDIYASNGVLHTVSDLLIPEGALQLTPEKYLLALNCTSFVSLIHSVNLTSLINDASTQYTILAPKDDIIGMFGDDELPEKGSEELKKLLQYHFIPGKWTPKKLKDRMLLETALTEAGLDGGRQVLSVEVSGSKKNDAEDRSVRFGGAGVIGDVVEVDNTLIYFVSRTLTPPVDALQTALPSLELSSFLAAVFSTSLGDFLKTTPRTTILIPHNDAFKRLGMLVSDHLLAPSSKTDLERVITHHIIDGVEYAQTLQNGSQKTFGTLQGTDVHVERHANGSVMVLASGGWAGMRAELLPKDMLTQTGVVHELSDIMIPRSVNLTVGKLMKAAKGSTMATMVVKAGMDWILDGTPPPEGSEWADKGLNGVGWTVLCPTDDSFKKYNLTELYADDETLRAIVSQHLIPTPRPTSSESLSTLDILNNNLPLALDDLATYSTLLSPISAYGDIIVRALDSDSDLTYLVGIKGARGTDGRADWARVLSWGRSTTGGGSGGVIQIDRLLVPYRAPWWVEYGAPVGVGAFGVTMICLFFWVVNIFWRKDTTEATYEPLGGFGEEVRQSSSAADSVKSFVCGGFGGIAAVLVGHPFDLTKTRIQTAAPGVYSSAMDVVRKTLARDGVTGMYRGMVPPLLGVTPIFAVSFWAYDMSKILILKMTPNRTSTELSIPELAAAGFMSAIPTTLVTAPVERAKVILQIQGQGGSDAKYKGVTDVVKHLYKEGGIRSVFRGSFATVLRDGPGSAAYFAAYEVTKKALTPAGASPSELNLGAVIMAGGTAGVAMWAVAIPPDVLKSRIQSAPTGTYSGFLDCARKTIAADGVAALWRGLGPAMARAFPANAATFLGVEASRKLLDSIYGSSSRGRWSFPTSSARSRGWMDVTAISRNLAHFEKWSAYQGCDQAAYGDLPDAMKVDVAEVFGVDARLPLSWFRFLSAFGSTEMLAFIQAAYDGSPDLFSDDLSFAESKHLFADLSIVFSAWSKLNWMLKSKEKWSEADYVSNVYNVFRNPAIRQSTHRAQCTLSLPQPLPHLKVSPKSARVLNTKTAVPDSIIFIPAAQIRSLSQSSKSPYKILKSHPSIPNTGSESSFRFQSTPCAQLPDTPGFEFVSSVWEDKKPVHNLLEDAYRQNRMGCASVLRHLESMKVKCPVFGLVWAHGVVRAHVDWLVDGKKHPVQKPAKVILSAPYPGPRDKKDNGLFHEWHLSRPSDILQVYFLIRNIDEWTIGKFRQRVSDGVHEFAKAVVDDKENFTPWKRIGDLLVPIVLSDVKEENVILSTSAASSAASPPKTKTKTRRRRVE